ncbi:MAG: FG-GAP-like repeat-containing protein [Bacteroidota bacterium]
MQLKLGFSAASISLVLSSASLNAQELGPFVENQPANPFSEGVVSSNPEFANERPALVDIDGDGDLDVFLNTDAGIVFLRNDGTPGEPYFIQFYGGSNNPLASVSINSYASITFADLDKDGDFDLISGNAYQYQYFPINNIRFYENEGTPTNPSFSGSQASFPNPVSNLFSDTYRADPTFVDIDDDGDLDAFIGGTIGLNYPAQNRWAETVKFWRNDGSLPNPGFSQENSGNNPIEIVNPEFSGTIDHASPTFADIDGDGDQDLAIGDDAGILHYFRNDGNANTPNFPQEITGTDNPFDGINVGSYAKPVFGDIDTDGDLDLLIGNLPDEVLRYFENVGDANNPMFVERSGASNPFVGTNINPTLTDRDATISFVDLNADGAIDAVLGNKYGGNLKYYRNDGSGHFEDVPIADDPFQSLLTTPNNAQTDPDFVDINGDGVQDLFVGLKRSIVGVPDPAILEFFTNSDATNPNFTAQSGPINSEVADNKYSPAFSDVDFDGDFDLALGSLNDGTIRYFENTGNSTSPAFTERFGSDNPFEAISNALPGISAYANPVFVDIDHDSVDDLFVGIGGTSGALPDNGQVKFYVTGNNGFVEDITNNPLGFVDVGQDANLDFADVDGDGDLDAFIGDSYDGKINYFENQNEPPTLNSNNDLAVYTEGDDPVLLVSDAELSDDGDDFIISVDVEITSNLETGADFLDVDVGGTGITSFYDEQNGILNLFGTASLSDYQNVLQTITFQNISSNPEDDVKTVTFTVIDFDNTDPFLDSNPEFTVDIEIIPVNDPPFVETSVRGGSGIFTIDLCTLITDTDHSFEELAIRVLSTTSGVATSIDGCDLILDYREISFDGVDNIELEACDPLDACDINALEITVETSEFFVYNAVSPNADGRNDWWIIEGLTSPNNIRIFNRWGDEVKVLNDYVGRSDVPNSALDDLISGTYFYKIESPEGSFNGYLTIKK